MDHTINFEDLFESVPNYRKIVLLIILIQKINDILKQNGYSKNDVNRLCREIENILMDQSEDFTTNEEESNIDKILNK